MVYQYAFIKARVLTTRVLPVPPTCSSPVKIALNTRPSIWAPGTLVAAVGQVPVPFYQKPEYSHREYYPSCQHTRHRYEYHSIFAKHLGLEYPVPGGYPSVEGLPEYPPKLAVNTRGYRGDVFPKVGGYLTGTRRVTPLFNSGVHHLVLLYVMDMFPLRINKS